YGDSRFAAVDIRRPQLPEAIRRERPDVVSHHATQAFVIVSINDPRAVADVNVLGTLNLCTLCVQFGDRRRIFASTGGAIYGDPQRIPADEQHPTMPLSPYGIHKLVGEHYVRYFGSGLT